MLNNKLYSNLFSTPEMRQIWADSSTTSHWLHIEQALADVQAQMGLIPSDTATALAEIKYENIDLERLAEDTLIVGRPIVGFVKQLRGLVGPEHSSHIHFGTTTQDILDTATVLQLKAGLDQIVKSLRIVIADIEHLAEQHSDTKMIGRTNGQHAKPVNFGTKAALWASELHRRMEVINEASQRGLQLQLGGPVGNLDAFDEETGLILRRMLAERLSLQSMDLSWQNTRDGIGDIILSLGQLGTTVEKISHNINLLSSSEIGELYEVHTQGKGASSSMPHKRNQRCSEFGEAIGRLIRNRAMQIGETANHEHERSGGAWISEWVIIPEVFLLSSGAMKWMQLLFKNLQIDTSRMSENLKVAMEQIRLK